MTSESDSRKSRIGECMAIGVALGVALGAAMGNTMGASWSAWTTTVEPCSTT